MKKYDILVVGASTTGAYFAWKMAENGHKVLVIEKQEKDNVSREYDIFHMGRHDMERFGLPIPNKDDIDYGFEFISGNVLSPFGNYPKKGSDPVVGMHKHDYIMRLNKIAEEKGAEIIYGAAFKDFLYDENGKRKGAIYTSGGEDIEVEAALVADCSGIPAVARTKLPDGAYVENFKLTPRDIFYVVLYYAKYSEHIKARDLDGSFLQYKTWSAPSGDEHGAILGVGGNYSYDYAEEIFKEFRKNVPWPAYTVEKVEKGMTPYHRGIYSFTEDGFIALGDTACLTKPTCGEGCTSSLYQVEIAIDVINKLLKDGKALTKENMWSINKRYIDVQGKDFDSMRPLLIGVVSPSYEEAEYLFKHDVIFSQKILGGQGADLDLTPGDIAKMVAFITGGVATGKLKAKNVGKILKGLVRMLEITKLYEEYPETADGYFEWKKKADEKWAEIGSIADTCDEKILAKLGIKK